MKFVWIGFIAVFLFCANFVQAVYPEAVSADERKVLFVNDGAQKGSTAFDERFRAVFRDSGIAFDEVSAGNADSVDISQYRAIVIHSMVMALNAKSPVRDWLKRSPALGGTKTFLFVTASRWFNDDLSGELSALLEKDGSRVIDAVSQATKKLSPAEKDDLVAREVEKLK